MFKLNRCFCVAGVLSTLAMSSVNPVWGTRKSVDEVVSTILPVCYRNFEKISEMLGRVGEILKTDIDLDTARNACELLGIRVTSDEGATCAYALLKLGYPSVSIKKLSEASIIKLCNIHFEGRTPAVLDIDTFNTEMVKEYFDTEENEVKKRLEQSMPTPKDRLHAAVLLFLNCDPEDIIAKGSRGCEGIFESLKEISDFTNSIEDTSYRYMDLDSSRKFELYTSLMYEDFMKDIRLCISRRGIPDMASLQILLENLKSCGGVISLSLSRCRTWEDVIPFANLLSDIIAQNDTITYLCADDNDIGKIGDSWISDTDEKSIAEALKKNSTITEVSFSGNHMSGCDLSEALKINSSLTRLELSSLFCERGAQILGEALKINSSLTWLAIERASNIHDTGMQALVEGLKLNNSLIHISFRFSGVGTAGAKGLGEVLKTNSTLLSLDLRNCSIQELGMQGLVEGLKNNSTLESLLLDRNHMGKMGTASLGESLKQNSTLTTLSLRACYINRRDGIPLIESLEFNKGLISLILDTNEMGDLGGIYVALANNNTLTHLSLRDNCIFDRSVEQLGEALKVNSSLVKLDISSNEIDSSEAESIGEGLKTNNTLTSLRIFDGNRINKRAIADALKSNITLTFVF